MDWKDAYKLRVDQLHEMDEFCFKIYESLTHFKEYMKRLLNSKILK